MRDDPRTGAQLSLQDRFQFGVDAGGEPQRDDAGGRDIRLEEIAFDE